jgi:hypothetical protein
MRLIPRRRRNSPTMQPDAGTPAEPGRCAATTKKETRCKFPAEPGRDRCALHRDNPAPTAAVAV